MKRTLKRIILILVLSIVTFLIYKVISKAQEKTAIANQIKTLPQFSFTSLENNTFSNTHLKSNTPTIFIYFNSECDFCQHEAQSISDSIDEFAHIQLIFVSTEPVVKIIAFSMQHNLNEKKNIVFLHDANNHFSKQFDASSVPFTIIYDANQNLIKTHKGQLNAIGILKAFNK